ncbi:MAG: class I SAM-dependent methyltransferase [Gammaproteobacteria bacterium]|jgi:tRNA (cmo5U34)-methyltransferase|nr:class I SAM-dependent methyltransferase [Gammaproteobacteria bacterium]MBT5223781.1 class I SAM-dependent methyltransferase [Gammaproteobacteria bacterium]MBT5826840.1 class I SAM-dependent methyltransferase [Gammaproteobacteria bacterium]MBT5966384.1 class I SAM-dependent methyltransferase [Gammaproteobacteria bacterium]MBT6419480.1 class I SAM-dependent methyltransferase [Gammaproteobacteria bacterium]
MDDSQFDVMFSGIIGEEYETLKLICPLATKMSQLVGMTVQEYADTHPGQVLSVLELGGGTGITTLAILNASDAVNVMSVDSEPTMQSQAKKSLMQWAKQGRLLFDGRDALTALKNTPDASIDLMASAYTLHNFLDTYRAEVITEIFRVLKPGGQFINGDRYGLDDISDHTRLLQNDIAGYFDVLVRLKKFAVLQHWIVHLFADESENHVMRESFSLQQLKQACFKEINLSHRCEGNALVTAVK